MLILFIWVGLYGRKKELLFAFILHIIIVAIDLIIETFSQKVKGCCFETDGSEKKGKG